MGRIAVSAAAMGRRADFLPSSPTIGANAARSPFAHLPPEKKELAERMERQAADAREKLSNQAVEMKKAEEQKRERKTKSESPDETPIKTEIIDFVDDPMRNRVIGRQNSRKNRQGDRRRRHRNIPSGRRAVIGSAGRFDRFTAIGPARFA
ncbi:MAG TPA: hypothetical protein VIL22_06075 [Paenibacillaceae bacterium]